MKKQVKKNRVFVGLSGGVDSSVAAYLLKKQGYEVVGVHLRCWNRGGCDVPEAEYARRVAGHLSIPFYIFDMEDEYRKAVVEYMIDGYKKGITPNPDVMCNKEIKFGLFLRKTLEMGADYIATGHYVRLEQESGYSLYSARDTSKDQSYFLWTLAQNQLKYSLFPIGAYTKREIRSIAKKAGLPTADKKDSQGICFIGDVDVKEFLAEYLPKKKGKILDTNGKTLGFHDGIQFYTIGQRHGLGIGGGTPYYVSSKDKKTNTLVVAKGDDDKGLYQEEVNLTNVNLINKVNIPKEGLEVLCRVRYRQPLFKARVFKIQNSKFKIQFDSPQKFIAPGQSAVFYSLGKTKEKEMLGGGVIL